MFGEKFLNKILTYNVPWIHTTCFERRLVVKKFKHVISIFIYNCKFVKMDQKKIFLKEAEDFKPEMQRYLECMDEIKTRWHYIFNSIKLQYAKSEIESTCLHFRMIIESILFANLSSHEGHYYKTLHDLAGMWKIQDIIKTIYNVNPNYYPVSLKTEKKKIPDRPEAAGYIHFETPALSIDDLICIHSLCSEYLHPQNPFAVAKEYSICQQFVEWLEKIKKLLSFHSIRLAGGGNRNFMIEIDFDTPIETTGDIQIGYMKERD